MNIKLDKSNEDWCKLRVGKVKFKASGKSIAVDDVDDSNQGLSIEPGAITILIGPNNSGKSQTIRELYSHLIGTDIDRKILSDVVLEYPQDDEFMKSLVLRFKAKNPGNRIRPGLVWLNRPKVGQSDNLERFSGWFNPRDVLSWMTRSNEDDRALRSNIVYLYAITLDAQTRFQLTAQGTRDDPGQPLNHLAALATDNDKREDLRRIFSEVFDGWYFALDSTVGNELKIKMSTVEPDEIHERSSMDEAIEYHSTSTPIGYVGDGVRAFLGLLLGVKTLDFKFIMIDDPEAFLHPPIARKLGQYLSALAEERAIQLFISTHSADFISGCVETSSKTTIIRLTYDVNENLGTAHQVSEDTIRELTHHPLLRAAAPLNALFHRAAIIVEGGTDRIIYDEINQRLLNQGKGIFDGLFISTHSGSRIAGVARPLRNAGVPVSCIYDFDSLFVQDMFADLVSEPLNQRIRGIQPRMNKEFRGKKKKKTLKLGGLNVIEVVDAELASDVDNAIGQLKKTGIFVVPIGCLESWFSDVNVASEDWMEEWFKLYGAIKDEASYRKPEEGGVWEFIEGVAEWMEL